LSPSPLLLRGGGNGSSQVISHHLASNVSKDAATIQELKSYRNEPARV